MRLPRTQNRRRNSYCIKSEDSTKRVILPLRGVPTHFGEAQRQEVQGVKKGGRSRPLREYLDTTKLDLLRTTGKILSYIRIRGGPADIWNKEQ